MRETLKEGGGGRGVYKNWIDKYRNIAMKNRRNTDTSFLDRSLAIIWFCVSWCLLYWPVLDRRAQMNCTAKTVEDPFLLNTLSQKDEKLHTAGL